MRLPRTIGRYTFLELLGTGASGAVYRGREEGDLGLSHDVAIKVLGASYESLGGQEAFTDEARTLARIAHPLVVPIRHFARLEDEHLGALHVIVMPLVRGTKLSTLLRDCRAHDVLLPLPATLHLLLQLVDALEAVHQATDEEGRPLQIIHHDLKPSNLMVSAQGDLRVLDFGIAWANQRSVEEIRGLVKGTLRYLSPEQISDQVPDGRSDLYVVGAIAFEMLVGEPFVATQEGRNITSAVLGELLQTRLVHRLPALQMQLREAHGLTSAEAEHVTDLLVRLLQTNRQQRFPHARALGAALDSLAQGRPLRRARRWLATVVAGAPVKDRSWLVAPARVEIEEASVVPAKEPRGASRASALLLLAVVVLLGLLAWQLMTRSEAPEERVTLADTSAEELPVAPEGVVLARIAHAPPLPMRPSGDRVFRVELHGDTLDCVPRLELRAATGGPWVTKPMQSSGTGWEVRVGFHELSALVGGADYWIWCGAGGPVPVAQWRSEENPARLSL